MHLCSLSLSSDSISTDPFSIFSGKDGKTFFLSGACQTAYTSTQNCFCVSNPNDPNEANSWYLLADSER